MSTQNVCVSPFFSIQMRWTHQFSEDQQLRWLYGIPGKTKTQRHTDKRMISSSACDGENPWNADNLFDRQTKVVIAISLIEWNIYSLATSHSPGTHLTFTTFVFPGQTHIYTHDQCERSINTKSDVLFWFLWLFFWLRFPMHGWCGAHFYARDERVCSGDSQHCDVMKTYIENKRMSKLASICFVYV